MPRKISTVPTMFYSWAASYWINSDPSGLSEAEKAEADGFSEQVFRETGCSLVVDCGSDTSFGRPSINGSLAKDFPAGDVVEYTFAKRKGA